MSEQEVVANTSSPRTHNSLVADLRALGAQQGSILLVHSSLTALGWVCGGEVSVITALLEVLGPEGTLVMPAHSTQLTDPAKWKAPPVPSNWIDIIRAEMPAFDPMRTPTCGMGKIPELFRTWPGVKRSLHPAYSFAAIGPCAERILQEHPLDCALDDSSPLGRLYELKAEILMLGVGFESCTALHLAECRLFPKLEQDAGPIIVEGIRHWVRYTVAPLNSDSFPRIGERLVAQGVARSGRVGSAACYLLPLVESVDCATEWLRKMPELMSRKRTSIFVSPMFGKQATMQVSGQNIDFSIGKGVAAAHEWRRRLPKLFNFETFVGVSLPRSPAWRCTRCCAENGKL